MVTAKLICFFVFAHAKSQFSHEAAHLENLAYAKKIFHNAAHISLAVSDGAKRQDQSA